MGGRLLSFRVRIPAKAYGAEPLSITEIDAHPDSARIWATIAAMREELRGYDAPSHAEPGTNG